MPSMTLTCRICNLPMQRSRTSAPQGVAAHAKCRDFHGSAGNWSRGCRCVDCQAGQARRVADWKANLPKDQRDALRVAQNKAKMGADWAPVSAKCFICGDVLEKNPRSALRPMHKKCRAYAPMYLRNGTAGPAQKRALAMITKAAAGTSGKRVFICGGCRWCGTSVVGVGFYCSDSCRKSAEFKRRSSGASFKISPRTRREIYERDSWICQLCFHPVDGDLHYRDNWAASLDHIIPQSTMLLPDHSPSNLRLAHRMCNSMRGNGSNMTEGEINRRIEARFGYLRLAA